MKKLFVVLSIGLSSFGFGQSRSHEFLIMQLRDDSVFLVKNKLDESKLRIAILAEINVQRKLNNLTTLTLASNVENTKASVWGDTLIARGVLGHDMEYCKDYVNNKTRGEIIIAFFVNPQDYSATTNIYTYLAKKLVDLWMNSPKHRSIILKSDISSAAVGNAYEKPSAREYGISCRSIVRFF